MLALVAHAPSTVMAIGIARVPMGTYRQSKRRMGNIGIKMASCIVKVPMGTYQPLNTRMVRNIGINMAGVIAKVPMGTYQTIEYAERK